MCIGFFACNQHPEKIQQLQNRIDSLEQKLSETYKPGFGEFMSGIQAHHSKLWFAGQNENWELAQFEIDEIKESLDDIRKYETDRKKSQLIPMINPALDSIGNAVHKKDIQAFKRSFVFLTSTCNAVIWRRNISSMWSGFLNRLLLPTRILKFRNSFVAKNSTYQSVHFHHFYPYACWNSFPFRRNSEIYVS